MIEKFLQLLSEATAAIPEHYFQLPVANQEFPIFRERVYCYELYHQVRKLLETDKLLRAFSLCGEVDKRAHPVIRKCIPDFIVHTPGDLGTQANLIVIEVKPVSANAANIREDFDKLAYFVGQVGYQCGIELVYGDDEVELDKFERVFPRDNPKLQLFWHQRQGLAAQRIR